MVHWRAVGLVLLASVWGACGDDKATTPDANETDAAIDAADAPDAAIDAADTGTDANVACVGSDCCVEDSECDDGLFCNGVEVCEASRCAPGATAGCDDGIACTANRCDEASQTCAFDVPDVDSDGHDDALCLNLDGEPLGDDCDDNDDQRFPGNDEVCDDIDQDCDPFTLGTTDADGDGSIDDACCNTDDTDDTLRCGGDCNDQNIAQRQGQPEFCDSIDNDCDGIDDNDTGAVNWYADLDGDNFGDATDTLPVLSCLPVANASPLNTDCNDAQRGINPGNPELCDNVDNDCDLITDEGQVCGLCAPACGANATCGSNSVCTCNQGFSGDGITCTPVNVNECLAGIFVACGVGTVGCNDTTLAYECICGSGYQGTGTTACSDCNECAGECNAAVNGGCGNPTFYTCTNNQGAAATCADINECATNNGGCDTTPMATCANNVGAVPTCTCPSGYETINGGVTCTDINECTSNNGGCGDPMFYLCTNNTGATNTCSDINECLTNNGGCDTLTSCTNNVGAVPTCGACPSGYLGTGATTCTPTLTALTLSSGSLSPALSSGVTSYTASVTLVTQRITLTPTVPAGATVTINGQAVSSGAGWQSSVLNLGTNVINIVVSATGHPSRTYTLTVSRSGAQQAYVKASNTGADDLFGTSVAISGDTLVVGAPHEASNATGINGDQTNNNFTAAGAVYVFVRSAGVWSQQAYLKASDTAANDLFGESVAISGDTLIVGAPDSGVFNQTGAIYVFVRSGTMWSQQQRIGLGEADDEVGSSVAVSGDTFVAGAWGNDSNATTINGNQNDNSASYAGAAYVFVRNGTTWSQQAFLKPSNAAAGDFFGAYVALSGDTIVVGATGEDSNATGIGGNQADNSASTAGAAYVFTRSGSNWSQQAYLKGSNTEASDSFGASVAVSGDTIVVGATGEDSNATGVNGNQSDNSVLSTGAAYVFTRSGSNWSQQAYLKAGSTGNSDFFGASMALSGDTLVVGAYGEDSSANGINGNQANNSQVQSGAAYVFTRSGSNWSSLAYLKASNSEAQDNFGVSVAVSGDTIAVGAYTEQSSATGVNGNQFLNSANNSGAVYVFR